MRAASGWWDAGTGFAGSMAGNGAEASGKRSVWAGSGMSENATRQETRDRPVRNTNDGGPTEVRRSRRAGCRCSSHDDSKVSNRHPRCHLGHRHLIPPEPPLPAGGQRKCDTRPSRFSPPANPTHESLLHPVRHARSPSSPSQVRTASSTFCNVALSITPSRRGNFTFGTLPIPWSDDSHSWNASWVRIEGRGSDISPCRRRDACR